MKTKMNQFFKIFLLVCVIGFTSCGSDDSETVQQTDNISAVTKDFQDKVTQMSVPSSMMNSSNARAQEAASYFTSVKTLGQSFSSLLTVPPGATTSYTDGSALQGKGNSSSSSTTYTWTADGYTITYTITEASDRYNFEYSIDGNGLSGKVMDGYQLKDGSYAEFTMYSQGTVVSTFKFWVDGDTVKAEMNSQGFLIKMESDLTDNSGNIKLYNGSSLHAEYNWNADGTGSYENYTTGDYVTW